MVGESGREEAEDKEKAAEQQKVVNSHKTKAKLKTLER
jgi:hypothetical protein